MKYNELIYVLIGISIGISIGYLIILIYLKNNQKNIKKHNKTHKQNEKINYQSLKNCCNDISLPKIEIESNKGFVKQDILNVNNLNNNISEIKPYIIGICGGSGSGKTYISNLIIDAIKKNFINTKCVNINVLSQDSYYKGGDSKTNYDIPNAIDFNLLVKHLQDLISGKAIHSPIYDFSLHQRKNETILFEPAKIIIVEGILIFTQKELRELCDLKIFVLANESIQIFRRIKRDVKERGRNLENIAEQYEHHVGPSFHKYVLPSSTHADMIINNHKNCYVGVKMMLNHIINIMSDMCVADKILDYNSMIIKKNN